LIIPIRSWPDSTAKGTPKIMDIGLTPEAAQGLFFGFIFFPFSWVRPALLQDEPITVAFSY